MNKDKEDKWYWVDDELNYVYSDDFENSIDADESWELECQLKYNAYVNKALDITEKDMILVETYLKKHKDYMSLIQLSRIKDKEKDKNSIIKNSNENLDTICEIYSSEYKLGEESARNHSKRDLKEYQDSKRISNRIEKLL